MKYTHFLLTIFLTIITVEGQCASVPPFEEKLSRGERVILTAVTLETAGLPVQDALVGAVALGAIGYVMRKYWGSETDAPPTTTPSAPSQSSPPQPQPVNNTTFNNTIEQLNLDINLDLDKPKQESPRQQPPSPRANSGASKTLPPAKAVPPSLNGPRCVIS